MRIAYLTSQYPGTSHTFIRREVAALRKSGVDVQTFSIRAPTASELKDEAIRDEAGKTFFVLGQPAGKYVVSHLAFAARDLPTYLRVLAVALRHRVPGMRGLLMSFIYFAEAVVLACELRRRNVTHLHNHFANAGAIVGYLAARALELPWSFTIHGISETDYPAGLLLSSKIKAAEFVACASYFGRAQAMRAVEPDQWEKMHVVRCGLDMDTLPTSQKTGDSIRVVCVGRLSAEKGQVGLLQAFAELIDLHEQAELVFIGDGPEAEVLRARAEMLGIERNVTFAGRRSEKDTLDEIARSDIMVLPSFMEGLPVVIMEAMAIGIPVIASRVAGIPELVIDGETGLLFTPSDWADLRRCLQALMTDETLRSKFACAGRRAIEPEFNIEVSARRLSDFFAGPTISPDLKTLERNRA